MTGSKGQNRRLETFTEVTRFMLRFLTSFLRTVLQLILIPALNTSKWPRNFKTALRTKWTS